jgi:hypothetical protein
MKLAQLVGETAKAEMRQANRLEARHSIIIMSADKPGVELRPMTPRLPTNWVYLL